MSSPSKANRGNRKAFRITVHGKVQGIGFRPAVYREAQRSCVTGFIANSPEGAIIEAEGTSPQLEAFISRVSAVLPGRARINRLDRTTIPLRPYTRFTIARSRSTPDISADLPADLSICPDCLREMFDPSDRRYLYPFINCTHCGPRFTIVKELPYDRPQTTMSSFTMCPACRKEYGSPLDRRFHAQPNACPVCGPNVRLLNACGTEIATGPDALKKTIRLLAGGKILAIKSLGGYHLACDADNRAAIRSLRKRKDRPHKPFALMMSDLHDVQRVARVSSEEHELLTSAIRPIVLLRKTEAISRFLPAIDVIARDNLSIGVMLPYTPLHYLLFAKELSSPLTRLVMTSGNRHDEPIACTEEDALHSLAGIADYFLVHDRPIHNRCDDSIVQTIPGQHGKPVIIRRSRGFVPEPVALSVSKRRPPAVFAAGAELKNVFCVTRRNNAYLSPYIGDLDNEASLRFYREAFARFTRFLSVEPRIFAHDLHPDYLSSAFARSKAESPPSTVTCAMQHHQAHIASVMAEKNIRGPVIGFAFDGTGLGSDGAVWGGECFVCKNGIFRRAAHVDYFPLPGGDAATREPWRIALSLIKSAGIDDLPRHIRRQRHFRTVETMLDKDVRCPRSSSVGRLFDGVAALIGLCTRVSFEAQAAIKLEALAADRLDNMTGKVYNFNIKEDGFRGRSRQDEGCLVITHSGIVRDILDDLHRNTDPAVISARFHDTLAEIIVQVARRIDRTNTIRDIVLSGGVFQNRTLLALASARLASRGYTVHYNTLVPPNDGGIALGQAWLAMEQPGTSRRGAHTACV